MTTEECVLVVTTTNSEELAYALAESSVDSRLSASAQISGPIASRYWWDGAVRATKEWTLSFRTTRASVEALCEHIQNEHPYELPEIFVISIDGPLPYLEWIAGEVTPQ